MVWLPGHGLRATAAPSAALGEWYGAREGELGKAGRPAEAKPGEVSGEACSSAAVVLGAPERESERQRAREQGRRLGLVPEWELRVGLAER